VRAPRNRDELIVWRTVIALSLAVLILAADSASARSAKVRGPFLLVTLPALGTVTWRCEDSRQADFALGFRAFAASADVHVRLHVGRRTIRRRQVLPGRSVRLPFLRSRVQQLDIIQGTGAGTLRAFVRVHFVPNYPSTYCWSYMPPRIDVRVHPRQ
jgi:hypothetical protein